MRVERGGRGGRERVPCRERRHRESSEEPRGRGRAGVQLCTRSIMRFTVATSLGVAPTDTASMMHTVIVTSPMMRGSARGQFSCSAAKRSNLPLVHVHHNRWCRPALCTVGEIIALILTLTLTLECTSNADPPPHETIFINSRSRHPPRSCGWVCAPPSPLTEWLSGHVYTRTLSQTNTTSSSSRSSFVR